MYFWRDDLLFTELKENRLSERAKFTYYLITGGLYVAVMWMGRSDTGAMTAYDHAEYAIDMALLIGGTSLAWKSYKPEGLFVERVVSLSVPILLRTLTIAVILGLFAALSTIWLPEYPWTNLLISLIVQSWFYFRLYRHMKAF